MSGWEEGVPGAVEPMPQQISEAVARVHRALREILPPSDELLEASIDAHLMPWVTKWEKKRIGWMELLENFGEREMLGAESVNSLKWMERELIMMIEIDADKLLELQSILDEE